MTRAICILPTIWGTVAASTESISHDTPFSFALLLGGIGASLALAWFARGERDRVDAKLEGIENKIDNLYCVRHGLDKCGRDEAEK